MPGCSVCEMKMRWADSTRAVAVVADGMGGLMAEDGQSYRSRCRARAFKRGGHT